MPVFTTPSSLRFRRAARPTILTTPVPTSSEPTPAPEAPTTPLSLSQTAALPAPAEPDSVPADGVTPENASVALKAQRAFERERHRTHQRKARARHELERSEGHVAPCEHCREVSGGKDAARARKHAHTHAAQDAACRSPVEDIVADVVEREAQARSGRVAPAAEQLRLGAFPVKPAKARKTKAGEFELVPGMPVVIALDDHLAADAELDEPWEHISADELDEKRVLPPSYATVVANAA
ncbi:uncharacterized protein BXZ73DRAFT_54876 [Epithele typhae]|uniref:uncharacterized protein n=1 Tax=Epithele typhae TaxID=378194 RepID=UPI0020079B3D|nr:uncharacterized protein BXZ73DRAFT_54876 [Epithele typhae]KAH9914638.1 hypothetical protein BXZ73DRAFT_54876 [Epithele typhae]